MKVLSKPQKLLFLLFIAVIFVFLGLRIGRFIQRGAVSQQLSSEIADELGESSETSGLESAKAEGDLPAGWESYFGIIREAVGTPEGTHQLMNKEGEVLILLKARDAKLKVSEGMEAEVQGTVEPVEDSDILLMTVEGIVFR